VCQITAHGATPAAAGTVASLQREFRAHCCARIRGLIEPGLLARLQAQVARASFVDRAHGAISTELCMARNACLGTLNFLANDPAVLRFVEDVTGCRRLTSFVGRVYRLEASRGHHDSWHADVAAGHEVGMSVNLGAEPFDGGVFEIRRVGTTQPLASHANVGPGDAILFSIAGDLEHRVTPMRGAATKTAFAGWFSAGRAYLDVVHQRTVDA
jgi:hypothetical protein